MNQKFLFAWDFHGTLEKDNVYAVQELCNLVLDNFGFDKRITKKEAIDWYGLSWLDYFKLAVPRGNYQLWKKMVDKVESLGERGWAIIKKHVKLREFSKEVLKKIQNEGHQSIVISNARPQHIKAFVNFFNLSKYFDDIIGVDTHQKSRLKKETKELKGKALADFLKDKKYQKVIMIGDNESDIRAGKDCGAITYLFVDLKINKKPKNTDADYIISDLRKVLE